MIKTFIVSQTVTCDVCGKSEFKRETVTPDPAIPAVSHERGWIIFTSQAIRAEIHICPDCIRKSYLNAR